MIETVFRSKDVAPAERFACWYEMATRDMIPTLVRSDHEADFRATVRNVNLGAVQVSELTYPPLQVSRTPKLIRQSDPEALLLWLTLRGTLDIAQAGRAAGVTARNLVLFDSSRPWHGHTVATSGVVLQLPRALLPLRPDTLDQLTAVRIPADQGMGALLSCHLLELLKHTSHYRPADIIRLSTITADLLAALFAHTLETHTRLPPETHQRAIQAQIHHYIHRHLGDPDLTPETIATAHQISTRYLYKLFQEQGLTVAGWIRQRRLERCHRDLADPHLNHLPIHAIATRWGFTSSAHFSRVFHTTYGMPPKDHRMTSYQQTQLRHPA